MATESDFFQSNNDDNNTYRNDDNDAYSNDDNSNYNHGSNYSIEYDNIP